MDTMIIDKQFREIVNAELERQGVTRSDLARKLGVGTSTVTIYLNGSRRPGPEVIEKFFFALGIAPSLTYTRIRRTSKSA